ncbi:MAG TPA: DUF4251 domain-containing protein [Bacteroidales bacterium]|jgi:hypothetical protein|nr:DUF4251 domain-containing protein [Bacteroidales bacterium]
MRSLATIIMLLLFSAAVTAQEGVPLTRQEKKALRQKEKQQREAILTHNTSVALKDKHFVLKADHVRGKYGASFVVNPVTNFVAVEGRDVYVQLALSSAMGYNGMGGETVKGRITSMEVRQSDKDGNYTIMISTMGLGGPLNITMTVNATGKTASAYVRTNHGNRIELTGELVPWAGTGRTAYKGRENY